MIKAEIISTYSIERVMEKINKILLGGFEPSLAIVYNSPIFDVPSLVEVLSHYQFLVMGATTAGEVFADEHFGVCEKEESIVIMLLDIPQEAMRLKFIPVKNEFHFQMGRDVAVWAKEQFEDSAIITLTSGLTFDNDVFVQGIVSNGVEYVYGGVAGDDMHLEETMIYTNNQFSSYGVLALALDRTKIEIIGSRAFGWLGMGRERIVTKSHKNFVYEIDGYPAINFYKTYLNITNNDDEIPSIGIEYPLEVTLKNGQIVYRAVLGIEEKTKALIFAGHVEENSRVRISVAQGDMIIDKVGESIEETLKNYPDFKPELSLLFPCCSRKQVLGHLAVKEIESAYGVASVPTIGFFTYGEIATNEKQNGFHNETFVTVLLAIKG